MATPPRMIILFDNYPGLAGLESLWGFACVFDTPGLTVLFDTGSNGRVLLRNMAALGIAPEAIDLLFLSHPHWDHIGGLDSVCGTDFLGKTVDWAVGGFHLMYLVKGAVQAAKWVVSRDPGLYDMRDILGSNWACSNWIGFS